ncbi:MAG TPA: hypothetical protein VFW47_16250 [Phenylobacterium sp.]|nr:hypothetical protein [Phenylobacterium sp.]
MSEDRPDLTAYVLVYDGENGVRMTRADAVPASLSMERRLGWEPWEPWTASDVEFELEAEPPAPPRRRGRVLSGVAGLCVLGLALGMTLRSPSPDPPARIASALPEASPPPSPAARPAPVERPKASAPRAPAKAKGQVARRAAPSPPRRQAAVASRRARLASVAHRSAPAAKHLRVAAALADDGSVAAASGPGFERSLVDCARAFSRAQRVVCGDPSLTDADRRLDHALQAAARAGAPPEQLQAQQEVWRTRRDLAARESRREVARVYEERIEELEAIGSEPPD